MPAPATAMSHMIRSAVLVQCVKNDELGAAALRRTGTFHSICRLCGNRCPILVTLEDGRAVKVTGNRDAAPYRGFTCRRGRALPELHNSPDRLLRPMKRLDDGTYLAISSEQALDEVAEARAEEQRAGQLRQDLLCFRP